MLEIIYDLNGKPSNWRQLMKKMIPLFCQYELAFERPAYHSCETPHNSTNQYFYKVGEAPLIFYIMQSALCVLKTDEIGTGEEKVYYGHLPNRVSKEPEMLFKLKDYNSANSNGYTFIIEKFFITKQ